ncbi:MAG TPA: 3-phosphoshikimate 1-carboxyvinyltransferase [Polyangiaceae bacterium]|jgi:3-phosphoshikimate 1-carboxyvinyltransferase|nr:3-phosphoshikimate 1-carboxyvinyltransferase [Polyangiaceae bacterium]
MTDLVVHPQKTPLVGSVPVPSDKSVAHRALLVGALCNGKSRIRAYAGGEDNASTRAALEAMGVTYAEAGKEVTVTGVGLFGLRAPDRDLDCGNSGTTMRLLCGVLSAQEFATTLVGDASLSRRPMMRVAGPLRARGARIEGAAHRAKKDEITAPLRILGLEDGKYLGPIEYDMPVASAQVKSALLLSGLYAHGPTTLREPTLSRDHTERMLLSLGVPLRTVGTVVELDPAGWSGQLPAFDVTLPGDISASAFVLGAALMVPGSRVSVRSVGTNPTRTGILHILRDMSATLAVDPLGDEGGEPIANLHVEAGDLVGRTIGGEWVTRAIDEIPALCAIAARARGTTTVRDAAELRVKESDRIAAMVGVLRDFGVTCEPLDDGMRVQGEGAEKPLRAPKTAIDSLGDHRIAMSAALLALCADGPSKIRGADCIATSFPRFVGTLRALGARIDVE